MTLASTTAPATFDKSIGYDRLAKDFAAYLDGQLIGYFPSYHAAEIALDQVTYDLLADGLAYTAAELDAPIAADSLFPPVEDPLPDPGPGGPSVPGDERPRYTRDPRFDKRIGRGDDYAGDAWRDATGLLRWVAVGHDPNYA